jgi:subtilisin family serine protease
MRIRHGAPSVNAPVKGILNPGFEVEVLGLVEGDPFQNNSKWYRGLNDNYYWSGGVTILPFFDHPITNNTELSNRGLSNSEIVFKNFVDYNHLIKNIPEHVKRSGGKDIKVAVFDTGVFTKHPDLINAFMNPASRAIDFTNSPFNFEDKCGHGTHVMGIIGARTDDSIGIKGVAPECELFNVKVLKDDCGSDGKNLRQGLEWAIKNRVDVINMSLNITFDDYMTIQDKIQEAHDQGIIMIAAAGNNSRLLSDTLFFPSISPNIISVGAIDQLFIQNNPTPKFNNTLDYIFPEVNIISCSTKENSFYKEDAGSSMSTAFVSGLVALIMSSNKENEKNSFIEIKNELSELSITYSNNILLTDLFLIKPNQVFT